MEGIALWCDAFLVVRARPCFQDGVFRVPKNGMLETNKPLAMRVVGNALAYRKTSNAIIMLVRQPHCQQRRYPDIWFNGSAVALDEDGNKIGEIYIYEPNLGSGNTAVEVIDCGQTMPDVRVQWTEGQTMEASGTYVPWETDYSVSGNPEDGYLSVDYSFYASDGTPCTGSTLSVCLLDEDGLVIGVGTEFIEKIRENEKYDGTVKVYGDKDILSLTKGVAMFANPYTME